MFSCLVDGAYEIYTIKPDGASIKRLTFANFNDAHMAWSPDGEYIAFASSRMGFKDEVTYAPPGGAMGAVDYHAGVPSSHWLSMSVRRASRRAASQQFSIRQPGSKSPVPTTPKMLVPTKG
jgi:hypothetical protein